MWKAVGIILFLFLFFPSEARGVVSSATPGTYRCYCTYQEVGKKSDQCIEEQKEMAVTSRSFGVYCAMFPADFLTQCQTWEVKTEYHGTLMGVFDSFDDFKDCPGLLELGLTKSMLCNFSCKMQKKIFDWEDWSYWEWQVEDGAEGTEKNPKEVVEGQIGVVELKAGGTDKPITFACPDCDSSKGMEFTELGGGKIKVTWNTSKTDWLTGIYSVIVTSVVGNSTPLPIKVAFKLKGVSSVPTTSTVDAWIKGQYGKPDDYVGALPTCAFSGMCRSVNDLLELIINFASGMFFVLGSFAFAFFVYGGFKMIISMGNAEKVKSGRDAMIAAALGLVVAIVAYTMIQFMLKTLGVSPEFIGIK